MGQAYKLTLSEALREASLFLARNNHPAEYAQIYWLEIFDITLTELVMKLHQPISEQAWLRYRTILDRLVKDEPLQYILGYADFMGHRFEVNPNTLIPREETSGIIELVGQYLETNQARSVLDIGTGSGIIPIMLGKQFPSLEITATDISLEAIKVAQRNATHHQVNINFQQSDLLTNISPQPFDIIVSNPPYISYDEQEIMDTSVRKFEPKIALFAENQGLAIYEKLAQQLNGYVGSESIILFEIGYRQGDAVSRIYQDVFPKAHIEVVQDFNQLDRYVKVVL